MKALVPLSYALPALAAVWAFGFWLRHDEPIWTALSVAMVMP